MSPQFATTQAPKLSADEAASRNWETISVAVSRSEPATEHRRGSIVIAKRYRLEKPLGKGAFGVVYRAWDEQRDRKPVALKITEYSNQLGTPLLEPTLLTRLDHSNIVRLYDYFVDQGELVLVMELIEGPNLAEWLSTRPPLDPTEIADCLGQITAALEHVHAQGVTHRDLKPHNILVDLSNHNPRFVLTDFGIGRAGRGFQTHSELAGTYRYMAPEQFRGRAIPQSDLWALGVIGFQLLIGRLPFEAKSFTDLVQQIQFLTPQLPEAPSDSRRQDLQRIVLNLLEKSPAARTPTARDVQAALAKVADKLSVPLNTTASESNHQKLRPSWDRSAQRWLRAFQSMFGLLLFVTILIGGLVNVGLMLLGCVLFWLGERKPQQNVLLSSIGILTLLAVPIVQSFAVFEPLSPMPRFVHQWVRAIEPPPNGQADSVESLQHELAMERVADLLGFLVTWVSALGAAYFFVKARRISRQLAVERDMRSAALSPADRIAALREYCTSRPGDLEVRERLVEALFAAGEIKEGLVEALLMLDLDPYHFNAALMAAEGYLQVGLPGHCIDLCKYFLKATPYAFEFAVLRIEAGKRFPKATVNP